MMWNLYILKKKIIIKYNYGLTTYKIDNYYVKFVTPKFNDNF